MKKVRCISPHGGCRNGRYHNGNPVEHVWDAEAEDWVLPVIDAAALRLPPNPGGYIDSAVLGTCAVGQVYDAPDSFVPDGFHFEAAVPPAATPHSDTGTGQGE